MNTCYRHPDRETGVSCQRCDRYICNDCATPAAVGFLCPEDSSQKADIRLPRFQQSLFQRSPVTISLIAINLFVYVVQWVYPDVNQYLVYFNVGDHNSEQGSLLNAILSGFAHSTSQITHILFNMYSLYVLGSLIEPMLGKAKFLGLYMLCLFGGSVAVLTIAPFGSAVWGASGAVFGLMGAYLILLKSLRADQTQMLVIIGINLAIGFIPGINIAWEAHVGGLVVGLITTLIVVMLKNKTNLVLASYVLIAAVLYGIWVIANAGLPQMIIN